MVEVGEVDPVVDPDLVAEIVEVEEVAVPVPVVERFEELVDSPMVVVLVAEILVVERPEVVPVEEEEDSTVVDVVLVVESVEVEVEDLMHVVVVAETLVQKADGVVVHRHYLVDGHLQYYHQHDHLIEEVVVLVEKPVAVEIVVVKKLVVVLWCFEIAAEFVAVVVRCHFEIVVEIVVVEEENKEIAASYSRHCMLRILHDLAEVVVTLAVEMTLVGILVVVVVGQQSGWRIPIHQYQQSQQVPNSVRNSYSPFASHV